MNLSHLKLCVLGLQRVEKAHVDPVVAQRLERLKVDGLGVAAPRPLKEGLHRRLLGPHRLLLLDVLGRLFVLVARQDVQQVVHNERGVLTVFGKVFDALGVGHAHVVAVRAVHQLRLLLGQVGKGGVVGGPVRAEGAVVDGVEGLGAVAAVLLEALQGGRAVLDPADELAERDGALRGGSVRRRQDRQAGRPVLSRCVQH